MISSALMMSTPEETSVASVREKRASAILCTTSPMRIGILSLKRSQTFRPALGALQAAEREDHRADRGEDDEPPVAQRVRHLHHDLRGLRQLSVQRVEDVDEDRDDEEEHEREHEGRERDHDRRVDHRALDAPLDLRLLLDLDGEAVEHGVERSRRLAGLDHRDEQAVEDLRVPRERLREDDAALDLGADVGDHLGQVLVVGLLLERHERRDDADAGRDHRRELTREDLQRLRLDLLERARRPARACGGALGERVRQEPAHLQLLARRAHGPARGRRPRSRVPGR